MKRILIVLFVCFFLYPNIIEALGCDNADKTRLQKFAENVGVTLEEVNENGNIYFNATFTGVSKNIRIYSEERFIYVSNYGPNYIDSLNFKKLKSGAIYTFNIYGKDTCAFNTLRKITINLPMYNKYYDDPICNDAREYYLCQKWNKNVISYDEFVNKVTMYKKQKNDGKNDISVSQNEKNLLYELYAKYYWYVLGSLIMILGVLIYLWIKENKHNKL